MQASRVLGLVNKFFSNQLVQKELQIVEVDSDSVTCFAPSALLYVDICPLGLGDAGYPLAQLDTISKIVGNSTGEIVNGKYCFEKVKLTLDSFSDLSSLIPSYDSMKKLTGQLTMPKDLVNISLDELKETLDLVSKFVDSSSNLSEVIFENGYVYAFTSNYLLKQRVDFNLNFTLTVNQIEMLKSFVDFCFKKFDHGSDNNESDIQVNLDQDTISFHHNADYLTFVLAKESKMKASNLDSMFTLFASNPIGYLDKTALELGMTYLGYVDKSLNNDLLILDQHLDTKSFYLKSAHDVMTIEDVGLSEKSTRMAVSAKFLKICLSSLPSDFEVRIKKITDHDNLAENLYFKSEEKSREMVLCCVLAPDLLNQNV